MPGTAVPFRWITGLPPEAQREIERDFLALQEQINPSLTVFDAIIDPYATSDASVHTYANLTDLVAHETWTSGKLFSVGVHQRQDVAINEVGFSIDISGVGDLLLFGLTQGPITNPWNWAPLVMRLTQKLIVVNLNIDTTVISA